MSAVDAKDLLESIATFSTPDGERKVRLGTIDSGYSGGLARVRFDGETTTSGKGYASLASYAPRPNERVALLPVGTSYLILGGVATSSSGIVMQSPNGTYWRLSPSNAGATVWTQL